MLSKMNLEKWEAFASRDFLSFFSPSESIVNFAFLNFPVGSWRLLTNPLTWKKTQVFQAYASDFRQQRKID